MAYKRQKIETPFGYFGSKHKIALAICRQLPPHNAWVEAFCGSAAVTLSKKPAPIEVINDLDGEVINFFRQLRSKEIALCKAVSLTPYSREELRLARATKRSLPPFEKARRFLVSAMMAVNGAFGSAAGGFSYSQSYSREGREARVNRWYNLPARLMAVAERLRGVRIEKMDAIKLLKSFASRPATLVYLDPPYFVSKRSKGYRREATSEDFHKRLLVAANSAKCMILISGYDNPLYSKELTKKRGWSKLKIDTHTKGTNGDVKKRVEVLWRNRSFVKALRTKKIPVHITSQERKNYKINPSRNS